MRKIIIIIKSKLLRFNINSTEISIIYLNGTPVTDVNKDKHLENYMSTDIYDWNILVMYVIFLSKEH